MEVVVAALVSTSELEVEAVSRVMIVETCGLDDIGGSGANGCILSSQETTRELKKQKKKKLNLSLKTQIDMIAEQYRKALKNRVEFGLLSIFN